MKGKEWRVPDPPVLPQAYIPLAEKQQRLEQLLDDPCWSQLPASVIAVTAGCTKRQVNIRKKERGEQRRHLQRWKGVEPMRVTQEEARTQTARTNPDPVRAIRTPTGPTSLPPLAVAQLPDELLAELPNISRVIQRGLTCQVDREEWIGTDGEPVYYFSGVTTITPLEALILVTDHTYEFQRVISENSLKLYTDAMLAGEFGPSEMVLFVMRRPDGSLVLAIGNGHHRLQSSVRADRPLRVSLAVFYNLCPADAKTEYDRIDKNRPRLIRDCLNLAELQASVAETAQLSRAHLDRLITATKFIDAEFKQSRFISLHPKYQKLPYVSAQVERYLVPFAQYLRATKKRSRSLKYQVLARDVLAVALATIEAKGEYALHFWQDVMEGNNLEDDSPALRLNEYLLDEKRMRKDGADKKAMTVAHGWNNYCLGRRPKTLYVEDVKKPLTLVGV